MSQTMSSCEESSTIFYNNASSDIEDPSSSDD